MSAKALVSLLVLLSCPVSGVEPTISTFYASVSAEKISKSLMLDIFRTDTGRIIAVGGRGHILWSDNQGEQWRQASTSTSVMLTAVTFPSSMVGYAVGHDAMILKTNDGGFTWQEIYKDEFQNLPLLDVWFSDNDSGFAVGAYGMLLRTFDGGHSWQSIGEQVDNPDEMHYNVIYQDASNQLYIAGEGGIMLRSPDMGNSWQRLESPYQGSWFGLLSLSDNSLVAYGLRGNVYQSHDQGQQWQSLPTPNQKTLFGAALDDDGQLHLVGDSGVLVSGNNQQWHSRNHSARVTLSAVISGRHGELMVVGDQGIHKIPPGQ